MRLLACPACDRPYDVAGVPEGTRLRCVCGERFPVPRPEPVAVGVACGHCGAPVPPGEAACGHCGAALLRLLCPRCFERMPAAAAHCQRCGAQLACQALRPLPEDQACPRCGGELASRVVGEASVIECAACQGLWLEPPVFEALLRRAEAGGPLPAAAGAGAEVALPPVRYIPCVRCGELMVRRQFRRGGRGTPVVIDQCRDHGIWLDAGELTAVVELCAADAAGAPRPGSRIGHS